MPRGKTRNRWKSIKQTAGEFKALSSAAQDAGAQGMKKGDLSKFVEDAVRWRMFDRRVQSVRNSVRDVPAAELQANIDEAVREVRKEARRRNK